MDLAIHLSAYRVEADADTPSRGTRFARPWREKAADLDVINDGRKRRR
jgi:hypothetical protein